MPISRKKSCHHCRVAKTRCSLTTPCYRCAEKGIYCHYADVAGRDLRSGTRETGSLRSIRPAGESAAMGIISPSNEGGRITAVDDAITISRNERLAENDHGTEEMAMDLTPFLASDCDSFDICNLNWAIESGMSMGPFTETTNTAMSHPYYSAGITTLPSSSSSLIPPLSISSPTLNARSLSHLGRGIPGDGANRCLRYSPDPLSQRTTMAAAEAFLTAKVLLGQILAYPRMMISGRRLPPFIHPPCCSGRDRPYDCPPDGAHRCLPRTLAICASLLHMFYTRTPASSAFVWEQIYSHQRCLHEEYRSYDAHGVLEALQAGIIYVLLQAQDAQSINTNDTIFLLVSTEEFARRFYSMSDWGLSSSIHPRPRRSDWVLTESARRIACVLYEVSILLNIEIKSPQDQADCPEYLVIPLPCTRELWEPIPDPEWERRYQRHHLTAITGMGKCLNIGDLIAPRRRRRQGALLGPGRGPGQPVWDDAVAADVARWCEGADEFGTLLWMATMMEPSVRGS